MSNQDYFTIIPIDKIIPNPNNPRKSFNDDQLAELAESIKTVGILEPLIVAEINDELLYPLVCGERRWRAAQLAGLTEVPVVVRELDPQQQLEIMLIENLQRTELDPIEEARGYESLIRECGYTETAIAEKIGKSQPYVANRLRLLKLSGSIQQSISQGILSPSHAKVLLSVADDLPAESVEKLANYVVRNNLSVARLEEDLPWRLTDYTKPLEKKNYFDSPDFDTSSCQGCARAKTLKVRRGDEELRCTNPECWEEKRKEAREQKADEAKQKVYEQVSEATEQGIKVYQFNELKSGTYEAVDNRWLEQCKGCPNYAEIVPEFTNNLFGACLNLDCLRQKRQEERDRYTAIERQRLEKIKVAAARFDTPSKDLLVWTIATVIDDSFGNAWIQLKTSWGIKSDKPKDLLAFLRARTESELCTILAEFLAYYYDDSYHADRVFMHCIGFPFPAEATKILKGEATINDIQKYEPDEEDEDDEDPEDDEFDDFEESEVDDNDENSD